MSSFSGTSLQTVAKRVLVSGLVQGVGYRFSLAEQARNLNVTGWCRNLKDGRVEAWLQGSSVAVEKLIAWLYQGPAGARVDHVAIEDQAVLEPLLSETIETFEIRK